jgi:hypothetical protein
MPSENSLWALTLETGSRGSWLPKAAGLCQERQCESCIAALLEALRAELVRSCFHQARSGEVQEA